MGLRLRMKLDKVSDILNEVFYMLPYEDRGYVEKIQDDLCELYHLREIDEE